MRNLVGAALVMGFLVSLLESICTGQLYLPTIAFVAKLPALKLYAYLYLVLYNLMFIVPLVFVFVLTYIGRTSEQFAKFQRKHLALSKILFAAFFFSLGTLLLTIS